MELNLAFHMLVGTWKKAKRYVYGSTRRLLLSFEKEKRKGEKKGRLVGILINKGLHSHYTPKPLIPHDSKAQPQISCTNIKGPPFSLGSRTSRYFTEALFDQNGSIISTRLNRNKSP